jgi:predicted enzyme related to lactoylglutathione lyase
MQFRTVWIEIPAKDIGRAARFYSSVFGEDLQIDDDGTRRTATFPHDSDTGVGVSLNQTTNFEPGNKGPLVYIQAMNDDMASALAKVEAAGGKVVTPRTSMGTSSFYGLFQDTEGNTLAFYASK